MGRYFFDFFDGKAWLDDAWGQELGGPDEAASEASQSLVSLASTFFASAVDGTIGFSVRDDDRNDVLKATLTLRIERSGR